MSSLLGCSSVVQRHIFCTLFLVFVVTSRRNILSASLCSLKGQGDSSSPVIQHETYLRFFFWNIQHIIIIIIISSLCCLVDLSEHGPHASRVCLRASHLKSLNFSVKWILFLLPPFCLLCQYFSCLHSKLQLDSHGLIILLLDLFAILIKKNKLCKLSKYVQWGSFWVFYLSSTMLILL